VFLKKGKVTNFIENGKRAFRGKGRELQKEIGWKNGSGDSMSLSPQLEKNPQDRREGRRGIGEGEFNGESKNSPNFYSSQLLERLAEKAT